MRLAAGATLSFSLVLIGCALGPTAAPTSESGVALHGNVHGGQQPIVGAHIYLFAANTTGYGEASVSLLKATTTGNSDSIGAYVTTDAYGSFAITGDYSCTPNTQVYLYALGGDPGAGINPAAGLLAALGNCPASGNFQSSAPFIWVNEVSTVAAAYAMAGFATDATHVASSGTALAQIGIQNAFANAANLAGISTGAALATTPAGNGTVPQSTINSLANILASCVNSTGSINGPTNPTACYTLFNNAESSGSTGTAPTDTATAAINIAHNPGANIPTLCGLQAAMSPFQPALPCTNSGSNQYPNDFTITINFTGGGLAGVNGLAIDGMGNAWFTSYHSTGDSVTQLSSLGVPISPSMGYVVTGLDSLNGIAIDASGNAWIANIGNGSNAATSVSGVVELSSGGSLISPTAGFTGGGLMYDAWVAIDANGNVWASNGTNGASVSELSSSGNPLSPPTGFIGGGLNWPSGLAIDPSGNVWVANGHGNSITELSSSGNPISPSTGFTGGGIEPNSIAIDSFGNVWATNDAGCNTTGGCSGSSNISELSSSGVPISPSGGFTGGGLNTPYGIAIDGGGHIWAANGVNGGNGTYSITELSNSGAVISPSTGYIPNGSSLHFAIAIDGSGNVWLNNLGPVVGAAEVIGAATPVVTPLAVGVKNNALGTRP